MMDPLSSFDGIAELIRRRVSADAAAKVKSGHTGKLSSSAQKHHLAKKQSAESVKSKIIIALNAIDINDDQKYHKYINVFVENILLWQFGEDLINDPDFIQLTEDVTDLLSKDPAILTQLMQLAFPKG